jgi:hypothetical protein
MDKLIYLGWIDEGVSQKGKSTHLELRLSIFYDEYEEIYFAHASLLW